MHDAAREWIEAHWVPADHVIDVGGRNVNYGTVRHLWPKARTYVAIDLVPGEGVDWVGDYLDYRHPWPADLVVCMEVAEHCDYWHSLIKKAAVDLRVGGTFLFTAAGPDRAAHSGVDGSRPLPVGEWYDNIHPNVLLAVLNEHFNRATVGIGQGDPRALVDPLMDGAIGDVYAVAIK